MHLTKIKVDRNFSHEESISLLEFIMGLANSVELCRQVAYRLDDSILEKVNKEWEDFAIEEDAKRRKRYEEDDEYREIFDNLKPENVEVSEIFDVLLKANLAIIKAEERVDDFFFVDPDNDFELDTDEIDIEIEDNPEIKVLGEELVEKLNSKNSDREAEEQTSELETYYVPFKDDENISISVRHSRLNIDGSGPIYEFVKFDLSKVEFKDMLRSELEESLFKEPINIEGFAFKSPLFYIDERPIMNISTENQDIVLKLNDEELDEFKKLGIEYTDFK